MKKHKFFLTTIFIIIVSFTWAQIDQYRKINANGTGNIVFANKSIPKGEESTVKLKTSFTDSEALYARCYFPKKFSEYNTRTDEQFCIDIYIDGKFAERKLMKHPDADWQQILLYVKNTGDDDFKNLDIAFAKAGAGDHKMKFSVGLERYMKTKDVLQNDGSVKKEKVFSMEYLSEGEIDIKIN